MYIADLFNHRIRRVSRDGVITTVAGTGTPGSRGDGGPAIGAQLNGPENVALDRDGNLYITDQDNGRLWSFANQEGDDVMRRLLMGTVLTLGLCVALAAQTPPLTNDDVVEMVKAQLAPAVIAATMDSSDLNFDLSPGGLITLKQSGVPDQLIQLMQTKGRDRQIGVGPDGVSRRAPEKSDALATSRDREFILRNFKTMLVVASRAKYFGSDDLKGALGGNRDFQKLGVSIVDDRAVADTILDVDYTLRGTIRSR